MNIPATLEERIGKESKKPYTCIIIKLTEKTEKMVFLDKAEAELVELTYANSGQKIKLSSEVKV